MELEDVEKLPRGRKLRKLVCENLLRLAHKGNRGDFYPIPVSSARRNGGRRGWRREGVACLIDQRPEGESVACLARAKGGPVPKAEAAAASYEATAAKKSCGCADVGLSPFRDATEPHPIQTKRATTTVFKLGYSYSYERVQYYVIA